jgi:hypothetical protein
MQRAQPLATQLLLCQLLLQPVGSQARLQPLRFKKRLQAAYLDCRGGGCIFEL